MKATCIAASAGGDFALKGNTNQSFAGLDWCLLIEKSPQWLVWWWCWWIILTFIGTFLSESCRLSFTSQSLQKFLPTLPTLPKCHVFALFHHHSGFIVRVTCIHNWNDTWSVYGDFRHIFAVIFTPFFNLTLKFLLGLNQVNWLSILSSFWSECTSTRTCVGRENPNMTLVESISSPLYGIKMVVENLVAEVSDDESQVGTNLLLSQPSTSPPSSPLCTSICLACLRAFLTVLPSLIDSLLLKDQTRSQTLISTSVKADWS